MFSTSSAVPVSLNIADCEVLAHTKIPAENRAGEADLFQTKWFDYRHLHPVRATYEYVAAYDKAVRQLYRETRDRDEAEKVRVFWPADIFKNRELLAANEARRQLDKLGVRYEWAVNFALQRFHNRGWRVLARPNQLYGEELLLDTADAWKEELKARIQLPVNPRFLAKNFTDHPDQIAWEEFAIKQIQSREYQAMVLPTFLNAGVLRRATAAKVLGNATVVEAERFSRRVGLS